MHGKFTRTSLKAKGPYMDEMSHCTRRKNSIATKILIRSAGVCSRTDVPATKPIGKKRSAFPSIVNDSYTYCTRRQGLRRTTACMLPRSDKYEKEKWNSVCFITLLVYKPRHNVSATADARSSHQHLFVPSRRRFREKNSEHLGQSKQSSIAYVARRYSRAGRRMLRHELFWISIHHHHSPEVHRVNFTTRTLLCYGGRKETKNSQGK